MRIDFKKNGACLYKLIPEENAFFRCEKKNASYVDMLFGTEKARGEATLNGLFAAEGRACLLGLTEEEPSRKALKLIDKDQWIITEIDDALVVTGWFDAATAAAARALIALSQDENVTLELPIVGRMEGYRLDIPDFDGGWFRGGIDCGAGMALLRYIAVKRAQFDAYVRQMMDAGFRLYQQNSWGSSAFATLVKGGTAVSLSFLLAEMEELRICTGRVENLIPNQEENTYTNAGIRPSFSGLNLYNRYADGNDIGMCLIFTLCDGSFLIFDGGYTEDALQVYNALKALNQRPDGKIVVAGWFFTHDHGDHTGAFSALAGMELAGEITVEAVLFRSCPDLYMWRSRNDPYHWEAPQALDLTPERMAELASVFAGDTRILYPHRGQKVCIRDAEVEILFSGCEDLHPIMVDNFNDTSMVCRVTLGGQTTLVLGDIAADAALGVLIPTCYYLMRCDILQVSHHGLGGLAAFGFRDIYLPADPEVIVWPTTWKTIRRNDLMHRSHNATLLNKGKQTIVLDSQMYTLPLPFDGGKDVPQERFIGDYSRKLEEMTMMLPRAKCCETNGNIFSLPLALTLSAGEFTDKAVKLLPLLLPQCSASAAQDGMICAMKNAALKPESYTLTAGSGMVQIGYSDYAGLRNALAAFSQLVRLVDDGLSVPEVKIEDAPVTSHRGVMLDIGRGVKRFDQFCSEMILMAKARMNVLHIHLCDSEGLGICLDSVPEAMRLPNAYTKAQIGEMVALADVLGLELIPEFDVPGHSGRLLKSLPQLRCTVDHEKHTSPWTVCAGKEAVFELLEKVVAEICELFPGKFFHMGGDELDFADAPKINQLCYWDICPDCKKRMEEEGLADRSELYYYFVKRIHAMVTKQGRRFVMWSEQMDADKEELLPKDILMQFWRIAGRGRGPVHSCSMRQQLERGYEVINSYYPETYIDVESYISEEKLRSWRWDTRPECDPGDAHRILGSELCCWEYGNEGSYPHYWTSLPSGIMLMADKLWNGDELPDDREYSEALTRAVLGIGVPEKFNLWPCFGGRIPPRTGKFNVYEDTVTATKIEREEVLAVLADESRFAPNDFRRACAYKARLENAPLDIPEPGVEPED